MPLEPSALWSVALAAGAFVLALAAEALHLRRIGVVARLALGPSGSVRRWVAAVPWVRAGAVAAMVWALASLYFARGGLFGARTGADDDHQRRVVFLVDLSPSMHLADAGPDGKQTRIARMHDVVDAVLKRLEGNVLFSVVCFYTDALPAVVDAEDGELVRNVFAGLPVWYVMESGKTDLGLAIREAMEFLGDAPEGSATLFVCTDGDTVPMGRIPRCPPAVSEVHVLGVGDPKQGTFIDGHMSRQNPALLGTLAGRLGGRYSDVNTRHLPTLSLGSLAQGAARPAARLGLVDAAILVFAVGAGTTALLPVLLALFGSDWKPIRTAARAGTS